MSLSAGEKLGPYHILERVQDERLGRDVDIKVKIRTRGETWLYCPPTKRKIQALLLT